MSCALMDSSPALTRSQLVLAPGSASVAKPEKLSVILTRLAGEFAHRPLDFAELVRATQGRAYDALLILLCIPFLTPVPMPFLSTALGSVMVLVGARLALGQRPWLPRRVL